MTREEKCIEAIKKGFKYDPENGKVYGIKGNPIKKKCNGYISLSIWINGKNNYLFAHQFAWYWVNKECVELIDHIDNDKTNNKINNLRKSNKQLNAWNKKSLGAYLDKRNGKWESKIQINGKSKYLGKFNSKKEANKAYNNYKSNLINKSYAIIG